MSGQGFAVLLDTCAAIWFANGDSLAPEVIQAIVLAGSSGGILVSPVSAWEIGMLANPRSNRPALCFLPDPKSWFARLLAGDGIRAAALTGEIAVDASFLPEPLHGDPADRLLIATARNLGVPLVTRDSRIIAYGREGHLEVLAC